MPTQSISFLLSEQNLKINDVGVESDLIERYGAVSEEVVKQMASNVREKLMTDVGIAISGVAGPGGGTKEKPVGMVWLRVLDIRF